MNFFTEWLQNWSDACTYANECWPDIPFLHWREPYSAIGTIFIGCFLLWAFSEWRGAKRRLGKSRAEAPAAAELTAIVKQLKSEPTARKLAA